MVLAVIKWDIHPDKVEAYTKWVPTAIQRDLSGTGRGGIPRVPGVRRFAADRHDVRVHRCRGLGGVAIECRRAERAVGTVQLALNVTSEVWGPSPLVPAPVRPGK